MNRSVRTAVLAAAVGAVVLGTATPGSAAGAKMTTYAASLAFTGNVTARTTHAGSGTELQDYVSDQYYDRVAVNPGKAERVTVDVPSGRIVCASGTFYQGGVSLFGETTAWANMTVGSAQGARVEIACLYPDGKQHRFHWGNAKNSSGSYVLPSTNCVALSRPTATSFQLEATAGCPVQDETVNNRGTQLAAASYALPFTATLTVPGLR